MLFIDEIHRLNPAVEEILYPAMEDYQLDLIIGEGPAARSVKIDLAKFTLVGATTRAGLLTTPLRDRFGIPVRLNFYTREELEQIVNRGARVLGVALTADGADEIARRARGTPRIAGRLLKRVRDFAHVDGAKAIDRKVADKALGALEVDGAGLDAMDRRYLTTIALNYGGGPVGVETIAAALSEPRDAIEEIIEPFLIQQGFLQRTPRGRLLTGHAFRHLGLAEPQRDPGQFGLFNRRTRHERADPHRGGAHSRRAGTRAAGAQARHRRIHAAGRQARSGRRRCDGARARAGRGTRLPAWCRRRSLRSARSNALRRTSRTAASMPRSIGWMSPARSRPAPRSTRSSGSTPSRRRTSTSRR